jgi:hypothetical protein
MIIKSFILIIISFLASSGCAHLMTTCDQSVLAFKKAQAATDSDRTMLQAKADAPAARCAQEQNALFEKQKQMNVPR